MPNPIYIVNIPELINKWDFDLNIDVDVNTITVSDEHKYWWKCIKGHSYPSSPDVQRHGRGCSVCAGKYVLKGVNDLETWCIENKKEYLLDEWDYEKNEKKPYEYTPKSGKGVYWICRTCGNRWNAPITSRTKNNTNCSNCSTSRQSSFPEQAIMYYLNKVYDSILIHYRIDRTRYSLDVFIPDIKTGIEYDGYTWHCSEDSKRKEKRKNEICKDRGIRLIRVKESKEETDINIIGDTIIYYRDRKEKGLNAVIDYLLKNILLVESNFRIDVSYDRGDIMERYYTGSAGNSLAVKRPALLKEWDIEGNYPISPYKIPYRSNIEVKWICPRGHHYTMTVDKRSNGRRCKYCYGTSTILVGYNDLKTWCIQNNKKHLIDEWDYDKNDSSPEEHKHGENNKVYWKCPKCGNEWKASILHRTRGRINCSNCYPSKASRKTYARNLETSEVLAFSSIIEASRETGLDSKRISKARNNNEKYGNYIWSDSSFFD